MSAAAELFRRLAQEAKVSPSTVTMALQDSPRISMKTKERVFRASRKLGYRASKLKGRHHLNFAVIYGQADAQQALSSDADVGIWEGISRRATAMDISLYTQSFLPKGPKVRFPDLPRMFRRDQCDGVLLMGVFHESLGTFLDAMSIPFVVAGNTQTRRPVNQVSIDMEQGVFNLMLALVKRGHKRCGFVSAGSGLPVNKENLRGFQRALNEAGCFDADLVCTTTHPQGNGIEMAQRLLGHRSPPTLIYTTRKGLSTEVALAAAHAGVRFDSGFEIATAHGDSEMLLGYPMHLVTANLIEVGEKAFDRLLQLVDRPKQSPVTMRVACSILIRA